ncbi:P-loop containing nucleoside triphosphate hydrolase protein [Chiua virens]|nr:P-loop containing nucleoside triphosphate hydrolase protein [Chiua virens]
MDPPPAAHTFAFDEDMDHIWAQCYDLAVSHQKATSRGVALVKPWHLALLLLFGDLSNENDPKLRTAKVQLSVTRTLELPLLWNAISRASIIHDRLDEHLSSAVRKSKDDRFLQQLVGQAFWKKVQDESAIDEPRALEGDEKNNVLSCSTRSTEATLLRAKRISEDYGSDFTAPQHVLLALLQDYAIQSVLGQWRALKVDKLPDAIQKLRPMRVTVHTKPPSFPTLNKFATDLTQIVLDKKKNAESIDPLIGRTTELWRLISILSKCKKNSAVLLGDPGVGKTAIAEALALRIVNLEVPESLVARVFSLDLTSILASTQCKLAYEQIIMDILHEVADHEVKGTRAILFFDNLSQLTVGGYQEDGSGLDAASIMKRFFAQGTLRCVGCSTVEDYRDHIEKDGALASRFSQVHVCESTPAETTEVLRGLKDPLERFHNVRITDGAFKAATSIATQYFSHKRLPDAALDLIDEACVSLSLSRFRSSEEVWKLQQKRVVMEIEIRSLERDMRHELAQIDDKIADSTSLRRYRKAPSPRPESKRGMQGGSFHCAEDKASNGKAAQARLIDEIEDLDMQNQDLRRMIEAAESGEMMEIPDEAEKVHDTEPVTVREVAVTASYYTFIPRAAARGCDLGNIININVTLASVVVGQQEAIDMVSGVMQSLWAGLKNPRRPVASILFGGPSGSGKTLLVKELAKIAARQSGKLVTIHASDYTLPHTISRLVGMPACRGFDNGGQLTECVKRKPFSVVYIKEIEHGCPEFRMLIQTILDEGIARDGDGNLVDFSNCIIIMSTALGRANVPRRTDEAQHCRHFEEEIHRHLPVEFLARVGGIVVFRPAKRETLMAMIHARLEELRKRLATINLKLSVSECVQGYLPGLFLKEDVRTAQRMERWIRSHIIRRITMLLLENDIPQNGVVDLDINAFEELTIQLREGEVSPPSSPASSYYSLSPADEDNEYSDIESVSSRSGFGSPIHTEHAPISAVRSGGLRVQPHRMY